VIINYFYITGITDFPLKTDPPLLIDTNAPLTCPPALQSFQSIAGRNPQIVKR